jgi:hypothetical protein
MDEFLISSFRWQVAPSKVGQLKLTPVAAKLADGHDEA